MGRWISGIVVIMAQCMSAPNRPVLPCHCAELSFASTTLVNDQHQRCKFQKSTPGVLEKRMCTRQKQPQPHSDGQTRFRRRLSSTSMCSVFNVLTNSSKKQNKQTKTRKPRYKGRNQLSLGSLIEISVNHEKNIEFLF